MKILNKTLNEFIIKLSVKIFAVETAFDPCNRRNSQISRLSLNRKFWQAEILAIANWLEKSIWRLPRYPKYRALLSARAVLSSEI